MHQFEFVPIANKSLFPFPNILTKIHCHFVLNSIHSDWDNMISNIFLICIFLIGKVIEHFFFP